MTREEHLLTVLMEECAEVTKELADVSIRASKMKRFGDTEVQPGQCRNNLERLRDDICSLAVEFNDLIAVTEMCGLVPFDNWIDPAAIRRKKEKVEKFLLLSKECGTLDGPVQPKGD